MAINKKLLRKELDYIKAKGGVVSIHWITETYPRVDRIDYLEKLGAITRDRTDKRDSFFPTCVFKIDEEVEI